MCPQSWKAEAVISWEPVSEVLDVVSGVKRRSCFGLCVGLSCDLQSHSRRLCALQEVCKDIRALPRILRAANHIKERKQKPPAPEILPPSHTQVG